MDHNAVLRRPFRFRFFNVTLYLIAANVLIFALGYVWPMLTYILALNPRAVMAGWVWQPFTYMFAHANLTHLLVNMLGLFFFGRPVERSLGSFEFLLYYLLSGLFAGIASFAIYALSGAWGTMLLGASGAIFALLLAFAVLYPRAIVYIYGIIPIRAPVMVIGYTAIEIFSSFRGAASSVAHLTHLAGFVAGAAYFPVRLGVNPFKRLRER
ncbi:MAG TPA: glpG protein [Spirochaetaceae bacterium]|nr:glpG protein [Spirochaetaceae bacterium]